MGRRFKEENEMTKVEFIDKYRHKFGCRSDSKVCWCDICIALETIWEEMIREVKKIIRR